VQECRDDTPVARSGRLTRELRQQTLMDFEIPPVDPVVVGDDHSCKLDILLHQRLQPRV
jgi:hypothetical protein